MKILREIGIPILIAIAVSIVLRLIVPTYVVDGSSMEPNFQQGEYIMVNRVCYGVSDPQRGQVIVFDPPVPSDRPFIKRIIGLPGETVEIRDGQVFIGDMPISEPYVFPEPPQYIKDYGPRVLATDEYLVFGDNRNVSSDSRSWGPIKRDEIIGKAWFIYWPLSRLGLVKHYSYPEELGSDEQEMELRYSFGVHVE